MSEEIRFPHSLGLLYSAFTYFCGFRVNSGEYKLMGLAPYGRPVFAGVIKDELIELKPDGSFRLNMRYFDYLGGLTMTNRRFAALFGGPARKPESRITQREADLAASVQVVLEEGVINLARHALEEANSENLCMAGGVALNCVANGRLLSEGVCQNIWVQPASGDAGGALGAALLVWNNELKKPRTATGPGDQMQGAYLGPEFTDEQIKETLDAQGCAYIRLSETDWPKTIAGLLAAENVVAVFQGRMEFGPRALGNRSILGDPRSAKMQSVMNLKIKYRESFRPFAPAVLRESVGKYFELSQDSPYMLLTAKVRDEYRVPCGDEEPTDFDLTRKVSQVRSLIPAVTHVDNSARVQTVAHSTNPRFHSLLREFETITGFGVLINTSFNVRGEPLVCTPEDAYRCFVRTNADYLAIGGFLIARQENPSIKEGTGGMADFGPD